MKGSQLHAQSPRRASLWSGRTGPFTSSCPKVLNYQKTTQELKSGVCVILLEWHCIENSALLYHWGTALGPRCRGRAQEHPQDPAARALARVHKPVIALEACQKHPNITPAFNMKNSLLIYQQLPTVQLLALMKHVCYTG